MSKRDAEDFNQAVLTTEEPTSPADPRPNGEPYYIDGDCIECGEQLVLYDWFYGNDGKIWWDEWICPRCEGAIYLDQPQFK